MSATETGSTIELCGGRIVYELLGPESGRPIVLTPGGRFGKDVPGLRPLAQALADGGRRVLLWDRPNSGGSDVQLWGESESHMRAELLANLLTELGLAPCTIAGGSSGARDSMLTVILHPEAATELVVWNVSGGLFGTVFLAAYYVIPSMTAVRFGGIDEVIALPEWQQLIETNPRNEQRLRSIGADEFWRVMTRWLDAYVPKAGQTIPGIKDWQLQNMTVPTLIVRGGETDIDHPKRTSYELHCLIEGCRLVDPPWPEDAWDVALAAERTGRGHMFDPWPKLAPLILEFTSERREHE